MTRRPISASDTPAALPRPDSAELRLLAALVHRVADRIGCDESAQG
ncbi:hypothetical protein [Actimicrobium antarcticum]